MSFIDKYFLEESGPFSPLRKVRWKRVRFAGFALMGTSIFSLLMFTPTQEPRSDLDPSRIPVGLPAETPVTTDLLPEKSQHNIELRKLGTPNTEVRSRQLTASQIVWRGDPTNGDAIPLGTTILVRLVNTVLSSDSNSPFISEIVEDVTWKGNVVIPSRTRAIGQATLDETSERLQGRFHTLVYPEGEQHSLAAIALSLDGSSGIVGRYESQKLKKGAGRLAGNFLGGLAQGLTDKDSRGQAGIIFEPGSVKNGILIGIANSSLEYARSEAENSEALKPYVEVPSGTSFLLFLEKEYSQ